MAKKSQAKKSPAKDEATKPVPPSLRLYSRNLGDMHPEYQLKILEAQHSRKQAIAATPDGGKLGPSAKNRFLWVGTELEAKIYNDNKPKSSNSSAQSKRVRIKIPSEETSLDDKADDASLDGKAQTRPMARPSSPYPGRNKASPQSIDTRPLLERWEKLTDDGHEDGRISRAESSASSWYSTRSAFWRKHGVLEANRQKYIPGTSVTVPLAQAKEFDFGF